MFVYKAINKIFTTKKNYEIGEVVPFEIAYKIPDSVKKFGSNKVENKKQDNKKQGSK